MVPQLYGSFVCGQQVVGELEVRPCGGHVELEVATRIQDDASLGAKIAGLAGVAVEDGIAALLLEGNEQVFEIESVKGEITFE